LNLRGAAGDGEDVYNAGLTADLRAAIASAELAAYETIFVLGYSLGGHLALRLATEDLDRRVRAVAAVCPPLDLDRTSAALDEPSRWVYRRNVLEGLKSGYAATIARQADRHLPTMAEVRAIRKLRAWDDRVVAPRFGYRSAEHYYAEASVAPRLGELGRPALVVAATHDPMIPAETLHPWLDGGHAAHPMLDARWVEEGGHVGFPPSFDLGLGGETGLEPQVFRWLRRAAAL
jgi:predicted alpha/beta-fold hydrolase